MFSCWRFAVGFLVTLALLAAPGFAGAQDDGEHPGKATYDKWCAECHGIEGDGQGEAAAWMLPRPRDFTDAQYQIRTTPSGALPTDADILRVINRGMPGTSMPGWEGQITRQQRQQLVSYLKSFSRFFEFEDAPEPIDVGGAPGANDDRLANGRQVYQDMECWKCHGQAGRGNGESAPTQTDENGFPIRPADLTEPWMFNGGGSVEAIYTRLRTGLNGTPMPSYADLVDAGVLTDDDLWDLALYVRSLSPEATPEARDVIRAALVEGELPSSPDDEAWADADRFWVPLVGQIIVEPRWFAPTVDGVWVQAVHDQEELVLRFEWNDPSESPDPAWDDWRALVAEYVEPSPAPASDAAAGDAFTIQLPTALPDGRELPFFLGGGAGDPVYLLRWQSDEPAAELLGRGPGETIALGADGGPAVASSFSEGRWRLTVRRPLTGTGDDRLDLPAGTAIPIAFFAQDGSNGETETRGSVSSWYFLWLDTPTSMAVYTMPVAATLITAILGLLVVARARRADARAHESTASETPLKGAHS